MAAADYRLCDVCGGKAFYDSNLYYEDEHEAPDRAPYRVAGEASDWGYRLGYLGDWAVLCEDCAKTHRTRIEPIVAARELDVEAERRLYERAYRNKWPTVADLSIDKFRRDELGDYEDGAVFVGFGMWLAARSAAQGIQPESAQVSTEQAGDAWGVGSCGCHACNPHMTGRMMFICATCGDKRCPHAADHRLNCQGRAPSPSISPVGGKGEQ